MAWIDRLLIFLAVVFVAYQVVIPGVMGRPVFPMFHRSRRYPGLLSQIEELREEIEAVELERQASALRQQVSKEKEQSSGSEA